MITFDKFIAEYTNTNISVDKLIAGISSLSPIFDKIQIEDNDEYINVLKCFHENIYGKHFNEYFARCQVNSMYHTKTNGIICKGEIYNIQYATQVYKKYITSICMNITEWDVYVALNAQYHDHILEYTKWFEPISKEKLNEKIIESTINFWFKDEDAGNDKVWNYFKTIG